MNIPENKLSFHDASLVGVLWENDSLALALEDVNIGDSQMSVTATVSNIESILVTVCEWAALRWRPTMGKFYNSVLIRVL